MLARTTAIAAMLGLAAAPALAVTWDDNDDGQVNAGEFVSGYTAANTFDRYDDDGNGALSPAEVGLSEPDRVFEMADLDDSGALDRAELTVGAFATYDTDRDRMLSAEEMSVFDADREAGRSIFENDAPRTGADVSQ